MTMAPTLRKPNESGGELRMEFPNGRMASTKAPHLWIMWSSFWCARVEIHSECSDAFAGKPAPTGIELYLWEHGLPAKRPRSADRKF